MTILDELIEKISKSDIDEQLKIICDSITREEIEVIEDYEGPSGPNIFLSLPVNCDDKKFEHYISLQREAQNKYIICHWNCLIRLTNATPKIVKVWEVKQDEPKKILKEFAEKLQFIKGE